MVLKTISVIYFIIIFFLIGRGIYNLIRLKLKFKVYTKFFLYLGVGLGIFPLIAFIFNLIRIPQHYLVYLLLAITLNLKNVKTFFKFDKNEFKKVDWPILIIILLSILLLFVNLTGAFAYPYLEDDDSWGHAEALAYVTEHKSFSVGEFRTHYLEPYPPFYDMLISLPHQINKSISFSLKFFNALLISLSLIFSYIFFSKFLRSKIKGMFASSVLFVAPAYMSHFIWAQTYAITSMFLVIYLFEMALEENNTNYFILFSLLFGASLMIQPWATAIIGLFVGLRAITIFITNIKDKKKIKKMCLFLIIGALIGSSFYIYGFIKFGTAPALKHMGIDLGSEEVVGDTSGGIVYGLKDFFVAPKVSKMDQPTGYGQILFSFFILSLLITIIYYNKFKNKERLFSAFLWLVFGVIIMNGNRLPINLVVTHRFWPYFTIIIALFIAIGTDVILKSIKKRSIKSIFILALIVGLFFTSFIPKYAVETSMWPPGVSWTSNEELQGYIQLKQLPQDAIIYSGCQAQNKVIGFDKLSFPWIKEVRSYKEKIITNSIDRNYQFLKKYDYEYIIISSACARDYGANETNVKIQQFEADNRFSIINSNNGFVLFKVN